MRGADILVMLTAWGVGVDGDGNPATSVNCHQYRLYGQVRAAENQRWFVSSNFWGEIEGEQFLGLRQVIDPLGCVVATTGTGASGMALTAIDVHGGIAPAMARGQGPRLVRDRRPGTYRALRGELAAAVDR